jgi:predicted dithiol-disulfide oxidoreductase (DUF899 family)
MSAMSMTKLPDVQEDWLEARKEVLLRKKDLTKGRGQLNAERRRLPIRRRDIVGANTPAPLDGPTM